MGTKNYVIVLNSVVEKVFVTWERYKGLMLKRQIKFQFMWEFQNWRILNSIWSVLWTLISNFDSSINKICKKDIPSFCFQKNFSLEIKKQNKTRQNTKASLSFLIQVQPKPGSSRPSFCLRNFRRCRRGLVVRGLSSVWCRGGACWGNICHGNLQHRLRWEAHITQVKRNKGKC